MDQSVSLTLAPVNSLLAPPLPVPFPTSVALLRRQSVSGLRLEVRGGALPHDIVGHAYYVGPGACVNSPVLGRTGLINPSRDGTPLFNGDPLLHRLDFHQGEVKLSSNLLRTPCFYTDQASSTQGSGWEDYAYRNTGLARLSFQLGFRNEINTAVIPMLFNEEEGHRLLLTWDAGRPYEIDALSLEIATAVGWNREWKEQLALDVPFGIVTTPAHPAFDSSSATAQKGPRLFTLNYGKSIATSLHPIKSGFVDAPFIPDEDILDQVRGLSLAAKRLLGLILIGVRALRAVESVLPRRLVNLGKKSTRVPLRRIRKQFAPVKDAPQELSFSRFIWGLAGLLDGTLKREIDDSVENTNQQLDSNLEELQRLIGQLQRLIASQADESKQMTDFVHLMSWDGDQPLQQWQVVVKDETTQQLRAPRIMHSMHQLAVTQDYVILMDTVFKLGAEQLLTSPAPDFPFLERAIRRWIDFRQSDNTVLYIIKRADLLDDVREVVAKQLTIPRGTAHFLVDYCNPDHQITLHCAHNTGWDAAEWVRPFDLLEDSPFPGVVGMTTGSTDISVLARYVIDAENGRLLSSRFAEDPNRDLTWMLALNSICQPDGVTPPDRIKQIFWNGWGSHGDLLSEYVQHLNKPAQPRTFALDTAVEVAVQTLPGTLLRLDTETMLISDHYVFPAGCFGNSVQFMPRPGAEAGGDDGYLMCVVNGSDTPTTSEFWVFDAKQLSQGPICRLGHPSVKVGLTIHSTWVPAISDRKAQYCISVEDDYNQRLHDINRYDELHPLFSEYVYKSVTSGHSV